MEGSRGKISVTFRCCKTDGIEYQGSKEIVRLPWWPCVQVSEWVLSCVQPHGLQPIRRLCPWAFPGENTGIGCHFLLQGLFLTQDLSLCLLLVLHWQVGSLPLSHLGSPKNLPASAGDARAVIDSGDMRLSKPQETAKDGGPGVLRGVTKLDWTANIHLSSHVVWQGESAFLWRLLLGNFTSFPVTRNAVSQLTRCCPDPSWPCNSDHPRRPLVLSTFAYTFGTLRLSFS